MSNSDQELILDAIEQAQLILSEYLEPGATRSAELTVEQLLTVLDRPELANALARLKAGYGLRIVK